MLVLLIMLLCVLILALLLASLRCEHRNYTFPQTIKGETHVACLDCGKELEYDWSKMEVKHEARAPLCSYRRYFARN